MTSMEVLGPLFLVHGSLFQVMIILSHDILLRFCSSMSRVFRNQWKLTYDPRILVGTVGVGAYF